MEHWQSASRMVFGKRFHEMRAKFFCPAVENALCRTTLL
jgi:hypothetical protein